MTTTVVPFFGVEKYLHLQQARRREDVFQYFICYNFNIGIVMLIRLDLINIGNLIIRLSPEFKL